MLKIKKYVKRIDDELESARHYAEMYVECKSLNNIEDANIYKTMAEQELQHSSNLHTMASNEISRISNVLQPTEEMEEKWSKAHNNYVDKVSWVKMMLTI